MYQEIKNYFAQREQSELLSSCVEKIHYTDKGLELYCGSNSEAVTRIAEVIEEGICDDILKKSDKVSLESKKGLTTWIIVDKKAEQEEE